MSQPAVVPTASEVVAGVAAGDASSREFTFTRADFEAVARMLREEAGIELPDAKEPLVYSRLAKRLRALGLTAFSEYLALVSQPGSDEGMRMLSALTTNVTRFFREPHHFEDLRKTTLPPLAERARGGGRVRLWSAGCSTGMEPYSMALCLLEAMPDAADRDVRILATDIDPQVLETARAGRYPAEALSDAPRELVSRWFERADGDALVASPALKRVIAFKQLNLMREWPMKGPFDVIFCRNVAIYFDEDTQQVVWERLAALLAPGARLNIGHSERIAGPAAAMLAPDGVTAYRRLERADR